MRFGDNLKNLRTNRKISQEDLAERVGVSRQSVSKWECHESYPEMDNILKLCKIFGCKLNDLVHEDLTDLDSLGEDVKMSVVKLNRDEQVKMKLLSKIIYVLAKIGNIAVTVGMAAVLLTMIILGVVGYNLKIDGNKYTLGDTSLIVERNSKEIVLIANGEETRRTDKNEVNTINTILDYVEEHNIVKLIIVTELAFAILVVTLYIYRRILMYLHRLFVNLNEGNTPFMPENAEYLKKMAILMIVATILPDISGALAEIVFKIDLGIGFEMMDLIYILFLFSLVYIFKYGQEIQKDSKGIMYSDDLE